jgi:hypothetical protein
MLLFNSQPHLFLTSQNSDELYASNNGQKQLCNSEYRYEWDRSDMYACIVAGLLIPGRISHG